MLNPTEQQLVHLSNCMDLIFNFEEEEKADQEDDSICAWYEMMEMEGGIK